MDDEDKEDNRTGLEKAMDRLSGKVREVFNDVTGLETKAPEVQKQQQPKQQTPAQKSATTALFLAVRHNNTEEVQKIIDAGVVDVNAWNIAGDTALHLAARQGYAEVSEILMQNGANPKTGKKNDPQFLPLDEAVNFGKVDVVEALTRNGGYVPNNKVDGRTLLHRATEKGNTRMVVAMIRAGADANERTSSGATPLLIAISLKQAATAEALLQFPEVRRGVNEYTNQTDRQERNAFQLALARGLTGIVETMLDFGANVNAPDAEGVTPLRYAILQGNLPLVKMLVDHGADAGKALGGRTMPVILAAGSLEIADGAARAKIVEFLISRGADPGVVQPGTGMSPLSLAIMVSNGEQTVAELLKYPFNMDTHDSEGFTPIYYTLQKNTNALLQMMIGAGADVNARQLVDGRTPLIQAVHDGNAEAVKLLLEACANPRLYDSHNKSALSYARARKNPGMVTLLENALGPKAKPGFQEFSL